MVLLAKKLALALLVSAAPVAVLGNEPVGGAGVQVVAEPSWGGSQKSSLRPIRRLTHLDAHHDKMSFCYDSKKHFTRLTTWAGAAAGTAQYAQAWDTTENIHIGNAATIRYFDIANQRDVRYRLKSPGASFAVHPIGARTLREAPGMLYVWTGQVTAGGDGGEQTSSGAPAVGTEVTLSVVCPRKGEIDCVVYEGEPRCSPSVTVDRENKKPEPDGRCVKVGELFDHGMCADRDATPCTADENNCAADEVCPLVEHANDDPCHKAKYGCASPDYVPDFVSGSSPVVSWTPEPEPERMVCGYKSENGDVICGSRREERCEGIRAMGENADGEYGPLEVVTDTDLLCSYDRDGSKCPGDFTCLPECEYAIL